MFKQQGIVLLSGLIILSVLTILTMTSIQSSSLQSLMLRNIKDQGTALEAAEWALRDAEQFLTSDLFELSAFDENKTDGLLGNLYDEPWSKINWENEAREAVSIQGASKPPRYVIQHIDSFQLVQDDEDSSIEIFKITARATGASDHTAIVLEAIVHLALEASFGQNEGVKNKLVRKSWRQIEF